MRTLAIGLLSLTAACLDTSSSDDNLAEADQDVHIIDQCTVQVQLGDTDESFLLSGARYDVYGCSQMYLNVVPGLHNWQLTVSMNTGEGDPDTCDAEHLHVHVDHATATGSFSTYGDYTDDGHAYVTTQLPGGSVLYACDDPSITPPTFAAARRYHVYVRADGHDHYHDQDVEYATTYAFSRLD
jgi:hypothetical protein